MSKAELIEKIQELSLKRIEAWKSMNYNYEAQLRELIGKLKRDLMINEKE